MSSIDEDLKNLSQNIYSNKRQIPAGWKKIHTEQNNKIGFYGEVYKRNDEVVIVYRGTDSEKGIIEGSKDALIGDIPMSVGLGSGQYNDAKALFDKVEQSYGGKRIVLTGHSLGGSLAQLVSAETGRKAVTYITNTNLNPENTYIYDNKRTLDFNDFDSHKAENMDSLNKSVRVVSRKDDESTTLLKGSVSYDDYDSYQKKADILAKLKEPQESRLEKIKNKLFKSNKEKEFDEKADHSAYINEITKTNKIFTKEDISNMSDDELKKNKEAIDFQKKSVGVPSSKQAKASGMVFVSGYTRSDGTEVKSYYRTRASFA